MSKLNEQLEALKDPDHTYKLIQDAVGKDVVCEDGVTRLVETIIHSAGNFKFAIVNYNDHDGGYLVHLLKLFSQLRDEPADPALIAEFDRICDSFTYEYKKPEAPKAKKKKLINPKFLVN